MSKAEISYYDWELIIKGKSKEDSHNNKQYLNSIGIPSDDFKKHLKSWKEENL